jgi:hypothetical protein
MPSTSITAIVPAYNEEQNIALTIREIGPFLESEFNGNYEILLSLAALAGRDVGTLANPQYEAVDGSVVRLDATIVAGIRTAVTRDAT